MKPSGSFIGLPWGFVSKWSREWWATLSRWHRNENWNFNNISTRISVSVLVAGSHGHINSSSQVQFEQNLIGCEGFFSQTKLFCMSTRCVNIQRKITIKSPKRGWRDEKKFTFFLGLLPITIGSNGDLVCKVTEDWVDLFHSSFWNFQHVEHWGKSTKKPQRRWNGKCVCEFWPSGMDSKACHREASKVNYKHFFGKIPLVRKIGETKTLELSEERKKAVKFETTDCFVCRWKNTEKREQSERGFREWEERGKRIMRKWRRRRRSEGKWRNLEKD